MTDISKIENSDLPTRVNLGLSERDARRVVELRERTDAATNAEVLRNALRLYEWVIELDKAGMEVAAMRNGQPIKFLKILL
jgi:hypothetical protein